MDSHEELEHNPFADAVSPNATVADPLVDPLNSNFSSMAVASAAVADPLAEQSSSAPVAPVVPVDPTPAAVPPSNKRTLSASPVLPHSNNNATLPGPPLPFFDIRLADPVTVGEGLKAYTAYSIQIKTDSPEFKSRDFSVQRRFREFLWLSEQLALNNPGVIVPPPPEKHAIGRFEQDFVENRRVLLERMLKKISKHPILHKDPAFRVFLESENFSVESNERKKEANNSSSNLSGGSSGGKFSFMSKLGDVMSSATNSFIKIPEVDPWFESKRQYFDQMESQLKQVAKAVDSMIKQREDMAAAAEEFAKSVNTLSTSEINQTIEKELVKFSEIQQRVVKCWDEQAKNDIYFLANLLDEYIRIMGAIKNAFNARAKAFQNLQTQTSSLVKAKIALEKSRLQPKLRPEKLQQLERDILDSEQREQAAKTEFEAVSSVLKTEIVSVEKERIEEFWCSVLMWLESLGKGQENVVKCWKGFFEGVGAATD